MRRMQRQRTTAQVIALVALTIASPGVARAALMGYWNFNEGSGPTAFDFTANNNDGTLVGAPVPTWVSGHTGGAGDFALNFQFGNAPRVSVPASPSLNTLNTTNNFTIATWAFEQSSSNYGHLFVTTTDFSNRQWLFQTDNGGDQAYVWSTTVGTWQKPLGWQVPDGAWHHLALTYDGTTLRSYLDGNLQNTQAVGATFPAFTGELELGGWLAGGSGFIGSLDDMVIFNSVEDVNSIMDGTHPEMNPAQIVPEPLSLTVWGILGIAGFVLWIGWRGHQRRHW